MPGPSPLEPPRDPLSTALRVGSYVCSVLTILVLLFAPLALLLAVGAHLRGDPGGKAAIRTAVLATIVSLALGVVARGLLDVDETTPLGTSQRQDA